MVLSRQEHCIGLPRPTPEDLPDLGIEPTSPVVPTFQADFLLLNHREAQIKPY